MARRLVTTSITSCDYDFKIVMSQYSKVIWLRTLGEEECGATADRSKFNNKHDVSLATPGIAACNVKD